MMRSVCLTRSILMFKNISRGFIYRVLTSNASEGTRVHALRKNLLDCYSCYVKMW